MTTKFKFEIELELIYFKEFFNDLKYKDDFGCRPYWNKEVNKWLELIFKLDKPFFNRGKERVKQETKREPFLAEAFSIYYFNQYLGATDIKIEPRTMTKEDIDFSCRCFDGDTWFVEVKNPGWKKEKIKNDKSPTTEELNRICGEKYINRENVWSSPKKDIWNALEDSIENSLHKFRKNEKNILVVIPDLMRDILKNEMPAVLEKKVRDIVSEKDRRGLFSKVIIIEQESPEYGENSPLYNDRVFDFMR